MMAAVANLHFWKAMPRCGVVECQGIDSMWDFLFKNKTLRGRFLAEFAWIFFRLDFFFRIFTLPLIIDDWIYWDEKNPSSK